MLFNSLDFFLFLAPALALFAFAPQRVRWLWLLVASGIFYGWQQPSHLLWLAAVTAVTWACGAVLARMEADGARRAWLAAGLVLAIGSLVVAKFYDFTASELALPRLGLAAPAGFSFYVFSAASYLVDAYRRRTPTGAHAGEVALYLAWFPKILAGPIERAPGFLARVREAVRPTPEQIVLGSQLIGWGLVKKVAIADNLAPLVDRTFGMVAYASPVDLLASVYFFAFQIYCDFSGYTDMAIGVSLLFGLPLAENFRRPYFSRSTAEFWAQRWHISLGRWFRDYLYIPLGGSRAGRVRQYLNIMLVFVASGLWHAGLGYGVGWTFLVWGALNGGYQWAGLATKPLWDRAARAFPRIAASRAWVVLRIVFTFHLILLAWVFFRAKSLHDAWVVLERIGSRVAELPHLLAQYPYGADHKLGFALIAALLVVEAVDERKPVLARLAARPTAWRWAACYAALAVLLVLGRWQASEFIYMQF
ncbi:MAG TPA: MBOAT family O-acyltransferase [Ramlibacter sp.]|uniref:MBOAT family O-acyltransferase n=1 Tax=Ramlibacter sp. TaxID=1917967 RepID=UPI002CF0C21B|nr:MBOAT family O-acyltransferase [Ramlibacter sp.]HVZ42846.1 MBOAT family O-acyltransferase [Ramlibacter sp.]